MMKVKVGDVSPNPHRDMKNYPINESKISALIESINRTGFWENIVGRIGEDGKPEIGYGHHRMKALKQSKGSDYEFNLIIRDLTDEDMLKMMIDENMEVYGTTIAVIDENVKAVMDHLREKGVRPTKNEISSFLGKAWDDSTIQWSITRLNAINDEKIKLDKKAVESLENEKQAEQFTTEIRRAAKEGINFTKGEQRTMVKEVLKEGTGARGAAEKVKLNKAAKKIGLPKAMSEAELAEKRKKEAAARAEAKRLMEWEYNVKLLNSSLSDIKEKLRFMAETKDIFFDPNSGSDKVKKMFMVHLSETMKQGNKTLEALQSGK